MSNAPWTWPYEPDVVSKKPEPINFKPLQNFVAELIAYPLTLLTYLYK